MKRPPGNPPWDEEYRCEIYRSGPWRWTIRITHGPCIIGDPMYGPPTALGRKRAEKKARRIMAKLKRDDARRRERYVIPAQRVGLVCN